MANNAYHKKAQEKFKSLTSETKAFTACFEDENANILSQITEWRSVLKLFCVLFNQGNIYGIFKNIMIRLVTLFNRQGKIRLQKWYESNSDKGQFKICIFLNNYFV